MTWWPHKSPAGLYDTEDSTESMTELLHLLGFSEILELGLRGTHRPAMVTTTATIESNVSQFP